MKIGFVLDDSLDKTDGVQQYILTLGHWLRTEGHEVHYLVGHTERTDIPHIHSMSRNVQAHFNQNRMSTPLPVAKKTIAVLLNTEKFDVLHVQLPYSPFMAGRIISLAPAKTAVVGTFHIIPYSALERTATKLLSWSVWRSRRRFDQAFSVSEPAHDFARKSFGLQTTILPNVVHLSQFSLAKPIARYRDGKVTIVFLGRLVERKGCMYLLQALRVLHEQNYLQRVRVLICGKGPLKTELEQYVRKHHLGKIVHFTGFISDTQKIDYLATADIAVFPSTGGESFGIVLIEAMAANTQVVLAGDNPGYRSVMGHSEQLIDPHDTPKFAKKLRHYIDNSRARETAHRWQKEHVKQYDVNIVGEVLVRAYQDAIAKRTATRDNNNKAPRQHRQRRAA